MRGKEGGADEDGGTTTLGGAGSKRRRGGAEGGETSSSKASPSSLSGANLGARLKAVSGSPSLSSSSSSFSSDAADAALDIRVGCCVEVYWKEERTWFWGYVVGTSDSHALALEGTVIPDASAKKGEAAIAIRYWDNEEHWEVLEGSADPNAHRRSGKKGDTGGGGKGKNGVGGFVRPTRPWRLCPSDWDWPEENRIAANEWIVTSSTTNKPAEVGGGGGDKADNGGEDGGGREGGGRGGGRRGSRRNGRSEERR